MEVRKNGAPIATVIRMIPNGRVSRRVDQCTAGTILGASCSVGRRNAAPRPIIRDRKRVCRRTKRELTAGKL